MKKISDKGFVICSRQAANVLQYIKLHMEKKLDLIADGKRRLLDF